MQQRILNLDSYGHDMSLNFKKKGSQHKTMIGGLITMSVYCVIFAYTVFLSIKVFTYDDDTLKNLKFP